MCVYLYVYFYFYFLVEWYCVGCERYCSVDELDGGFGLTILLQCRIVVIALVVF